MFPLLLLSGFLVLAPDERPACIANTVGNFWPKEANSSSETLKLLASDGELWMCKRGRWSYKWERPVVTLEQLRKEQEAKVARKTKPASPPVSELFQ